MELDPEGWEKKLAGTGCVGLGAVRACTSDETLNMFWFFCKYCQVSGGAVPLLLCESCYFELSYMIMFDCRSCGHMDHAYVEATLRVSEEFMKAVYVPRKVRRWRDRKSLVKVESGIKVGGIRKGGKHRG